jgi:PPK2 family polyphosphate:nucleotide phosphotransferase
MDQYRIKPGSKVNLEDFDPDDHELFPDGKSAGKKYLLTLNDELEALQELLYAEGKHKVLIVLQGMDTAGKDGTIRHVFDGVNPQGVRVASFGKPTEQELSHDYLWRIHQYTPGRGQIVIFNRSHYEDVLVVRVHNLVPESQWSRRYHHIREFEQMLVDEGTTILKFFLHINLAEQKERLQARLDTPEKRWKFNSGDLKERKLWPDYMQAFEAALSETSTDQAPWYVIPANRKWYRNILIAQVLIQTLKGLDMKFPPAEENLDQVVID